MHTLPDRWTHHTKVKDGSIDCRATINTMLASGQPGYRAERLQDWVLPMSGIFTHGGDGQMMWKCRSMCNLKNCSALEGERKC